MHKFNAHTLELFKLHKFSMCKYLHEVQTDGDRIEIDDARALFARKNDRARNCEACAESVKDHGYVCEEHYHDYCNQGPNCCWTCYVETVFQEQLGMEL